MKAPSSDPFCWWQVAVCAPFKTMTHIVALRKERRWPAFPKFRLATVSQEKKETDNTTTGSRQQALAFQLY